MIRIIYSTDGKTLIKCPESYVGHMEITNGVKCIARDAFKNCTQLLSVVIPESVSTIGEEAFYCCEKLMSIVVPGSVKIIEPRAFQYCTGLAVAELKEGVEYIGANAFSNCWHLRKVSLPESLKSLGDHAFYECEFLKSINIPPRLTYLGRCLISDDCKNGLTDNSLVYAGTHLLQVSWYDKDKEVYIIKEGTRSIGSMAFGNYCQNLKSLEIPNSVFRIFPRAFTASPIVSIKIPRGVTHIEEGTFERCEYLSSIEIPDGVTTIDKKAFSGCRSLAKIEIPKGIERIEELVFASCESLTSVIIPDGVKRINSNAFEGCKSLKVIKLPSSLVIVSDNAFTHCDDLDEIIVPTGQREKFAQMKAFEAYKFIIREESQTVQDCTDDNYLMKDGKSILLHFAERAEKNGKIDIAISLYEDAEKLGSIEAEYRLGILFLDKDFYKGYFYLNKAAQAGHPKALEKTELFKHGG